MRNAQGKQAKDNRPDAESFADNFGMAEGEGFEVVSSFMRPIIGPAIVGQLGFVHNRTLLGKMDEQDTPFALRDEQEWLDKMMRYAVTLAGRRALSLQAAHTSFLAKAVPLLNDHPSSVQVCLGYWERMSTNWKQRLRFAARPGVKSISLRSFMNHAIRIDFISQLASLRFKAVAARLARQWRTVFAISGALIVEHMIKTIRTAEARNQENKQMAWARRWICPVAQKTTTSTFRDKKVIRKGRLLNDRGCDRGVGLAPRVAQGRRDAILHNRPRHRPQGDGLDLGPRLG